MKLLSGVLLFTCVISCARAWGQTNQTEHVVIVALDGFRWQELFEGADENWLRPSEDSSEIRAFSAPTPEEGRRRLMPFMWEVIAADGQLHGNRRFGNRVKCSNIHHLSYPGYSEMLVGHTDRRVRSNKLKENPNASVLEVLQGRPSFRGRVAVFSSWNAFPYIVREKTSGLVVNSGSDLAQGDISEVQGSLRTASAAQAGTRSDSVTFSYATDFLKRERPKVIFIALNETDEHAHKGEYGKYLRAAHRADRLIGRLWHWLQGDSIYKDKTTMLITTDHGRGRSKRLWRRHGILVPGSGQVWVASIGPDTPGVGEVRSNATLRLAQVAGTIAALLNQNYGNEQTTPPIAAILPPAPDFAKFSERQRPPVNK